MPTPSGFSRAGEVANIFEHLRPTGRKNPHKRHTYLMLQVR